MSRSPEPISAGVSLHGAVRIEPGQLYWALLNLPEQQRSVDARRYAFEPWLPLPLDEVETRFVQINGSGQVLACGIQRSVLREFLANEGNKIRAIGPQSLPTCLESAAAAESVNQIEFRSGEFEHPSTSRARMTKTIAVTLTLILATALTCSAMLLQAQRQAETARSATDAIHALATGTVGEPPIDASLYLAAEHRRLAQTRDQEGLPTATIDQTETLVQLLACWPDDLRTQVDQLTIDNSTLSLRGTVRSSQDAELLLKALESGLALHWTAATSQSTRDGDLYTFTVVFRTTEAGLQ